MPPTTRLSIQELAPQGIYLFDDTQNLYLGPSFKPLFNFFFKKASILFFENFSRPFFAFSPIFLFVGFARMVFFIIIIFLITLY